MNQTIPENWVGTVGSMKIMHVGVLRCAFRIRFDGACIVSTRQPLPAGAVYTNQGELAVALSRAAR
jgi:hypothetical protein